MMSKGLWFIFWPSGSWLLPPGPWRPAMPLSWDSMAFGSDPNCSIEFCCCCWDAGCCCGVTTIPGWCWFRCPGWGEPVCIWGDMWCGEGWGCMRGDGLECGGWDWGLGEGCGERTWLARDVVSACPCKCGDWAICCGGWGLIGLLCWAGDPPGPRCCCCWSSLWWRRAWEDGGGGPLWLVWEPWGGCWGPTTPPPPGPASPPGRPAMAFCCCCIWMWCWCWSLCCNAAVTCCWATVPG